jgi:AraC-like DNA-binding protein
MSAAVTKVIDTMWKRYDQPLSLSELADEALFSRFYFSRIFRNETGTSPGRFLSAIRLFRAKNLLLETSHSVTDISYLVGYNSPGTFSTRFALSVGMSPAQYRHRARIGIPCPTQLPISGRNTGSAELVTVIPETGRPTRTYVGVFREPFPSAAITGTALDGSRHYRLTGVPAGQVTIRAITVATSGPNVDPWDRRPLLVSDPVPVVIRSDNMPAFVRLALRQPRPTDLPVLMAIPELDSFEMPSWDLDQPA